MKNHLRLMGLVMIAVTCAVAVLFFLSFNRRVSAVHGQNTREAVASLKNRFLKTTVDNQITRIEIRAAEELAHWNGLADEAALTLASCLDLDEDHALAIFKGLFRGDPWTAALRLAASGKVLHDPAGFFAGCDSAAESDLKKVFAVSRQGRYGPYEVFFGVTGEALHGRVKAAIADEIHRSTYPFDSYIWVNEVIDYAGGDGYAIRRIHPNLRHTEGMLLSTAMEDIRGNRPYLEELEGVRDKGELFFSYFFKKKNCDTVSEKLTYARLYRPYNWIVAFGIHFDDVESFICQATEETEALSRRLSLVFLFLLVGLLALSQVLLLLWERWFHGRDRRLLEAEANEDSLTGALSRRAAERDLAREFAAFAEGAVAPAVMLFDLDGFKDVNDSYGHDSGDIVLRGVVDTLRKTLRQTDSIYRWGGDEFLLLCRGLRPENVQRRADHLVQILAGVSHPLEGRSLSVTVSMGIAYFQGDDKGCGDVIKRADQGLYRAKREGRNRAILEA